MSLAAKLIGAALGVGLRSTLAYMFGVAAEQLSDMRHHLAPVGAVLMPRLILAVALPCGLARRGGRQRAMG